MAQKSKYHVVNARTRAVIELFPFDPEHTRPIVKRIGSSEVSFLCTMRPRMTVAVRSSCCRSGQAV